MTKADIWRKDICLETLCRCNHMLMGAKADLLGFCVDSGRLENKGAGGSSRRNFTES